MLSNFLFGIASFLTKLYTYVYEIIIASLGEFRVIYYHDSSITNITIRYYLGLGTTSYTRGIYYVVVVTRDSIDRFIYEGNLDDIKHISIGPKKRYKRKNIILLNKDKPVTGDLNILDNYYANMKSLGFRHPLGTKETLECLGLITANICFILTSPFNMRVVSVDEVDFEDIYNKVNDDYDKH